MPSAISGYEYDIFISYRQNDNRSGWVTEFVNHLNEELATTIKEPVSVYFDVNPHDGLLETHDVDESLKEKLRCLVFIPIISQTYCDSKSFAWQHEFLAFKKMTAEDPLGLKIKLQNGNVASRILPVRIHDLDEEDKSILENEIGSMRSVDFIFKFPGVNRPLRAKDDEVKDITHAYYYRDQINKVANAIKEIVTGLKNNKQLRPREESVAFQEPPKQRPLKKLVYLLAAILLGLAGYFSYPFGFKNSETLTASKSSIAVIPFRNNTGDVTKSYYGIGIASEVITQLGRTKQFDFVSSLRATIPFQQTNDSPIKIGKELGVTHILSGMYQTSGANVQVMAELIDANSGKVVWSLPFRTKYSDVFELQSLIASKVMDRFSLTSRAMEILPTKNMDAYYHYIRGKEHLQEFSWKYQLRGIEEFKKAIALDSSFAPPWYELIRTSSFYYAVNPQDSVVSKKSIFQYLAYVEKNFPDSWLKKDVQASYHYYFSNDNEAAIKLSLQVLDENPDEVGAIALMSYLYRREMKFQESLTYLDKWMKLEPNNIRAWLVLASVLSYSGDIKASDKALAKAYRINNNNRYNLYSSMQIQNRLHELPQTIKEKYGRMYTADLFFQKRELHNLLIFADSSKTDSTFSPLSKLVYKAASNYLLRNDAAARSYAKTWLKLYDQTRHSETLFFDRFTFSFMNGMMGETGIKNGPLPVLGLKGEVVIDDWWRKVIEMNFYIWTKDYEKANELLKTMNREHPQMGYYEWLNLPFYDRIKKEYPAFQQTISSLKIPNKILKEGLFKWE